MEVKILGKNIDVTDALRQYAEKKVEKIGKFFAQEPLEAQVSLGIERGLHIVDVTISINGLLLRSEEKTGDMYASIDALIKSNAKSESINPD